MDQNLLSVFRDAEKISEWGLAGKGESRGILDFLELYIILWAPLCLSFAHARPHHRTVVGGFRPARFHNKHTELYYLQYCLANSLSIFLASSYIFG